MFLANEYVLEKVTEPGVPINLESSLESMGTREFCLVRFGRKYFNRLLLIKPVSVEHWSNII